MPSIATLLSTVPWTTPSWDLFILLLFVVGSFLYGISMGRDRVIVILVSIYMALGVVLYTPLLSDLRFSLRLSEEYILKVTLFLGVFVLLFFLLARSALHRTIGSSLKTAGWVQALIFSFLQVGLLISIVLSFLPVSMTHGLADLTKRLFMSEYGRTAWMLLPLACMLILPRSDNQSKTIG